MRERERKRERMSVCVTLCVCVCVCVHARAHTHIIECTLASLCMSEGQREGVASYLLYVPATGNVFQRGRFALKIINVASKREAQRERERERWGGGGYF